MKTLILFIFKLSLISVRMAKKLWILFKNLDQKKLVYYIFQKEKL